MKFVFVILLLLSPVCGADVDMTGSKTYDFEVRVAPIILLVKWVNVETAYRIGDYFDVGINGVFYGEKVDFDTGSMFFPVYEGYSAGINFNYYVYELRRLHTWYFSGKVIHNDFKHVGHQSPVYDSKGISLIAVAGYRTPIIVLGEQFSFLMGVGVQQVFYDRVESDRVGTTVTFVRDDYNRTLPYAEFKMAYQF